MEKDSISKNMILQFAYQGVILVIPLIISPYLTRTLTETPLGVYTFTYSIAYYFVMLSMLGISRYGQRVISQNAQDEMKLRTTFWSLFAVHVAVSAFFSLSYVLLVSFFIKENRGIFLFQTFYVISALFDISWLFYGLEDIKNIVWRNMAVKIAECILIFCLVKSPEDLWIYTMICSGGMLTGQVLLVPRAVKLLPPIHFSKEELLCHIRPLLFFFVSDIAVSLYTIFDRTLLGILSTVTDVAFYEYSNRIVHVATKMLSVIGIVMLPRACRLAAMGDVNGQKKNMKYSFLLVSFLGMGAVFGLCAVGTQFATFYYGYSFLVCGGVIKALSPLVFIIGAGEVVRAQYMIPNHMDKQYMACMLLSASLNLVLSICLIPFLGIYGAVIGTLAAELAGFVYQLILCRKFIRIGEIAGCTAPFILFGFVMFMGIKAMQHVLPCSAISLVAEMAAGAGIYLVLSFFYLVRFRRELYIRLKRIFMP